jgi:AbrB family looped-hinge helix DNA binding protein
MSEAVDSILRKGYSGHVKTSMSSKGRIVLPAALRERDGIVPGDEFSVERIDEGQYVLKRIKRSNEGLVDWLLACPEKDFFVPIKSESTNAM